MTLDEAIEELTEPYNERQNIISPRFMEAHKLAIRAMQCLQYIRRNKGGQWELTLLGETKE